MAKRSNTKSPTKKGGEDVGILLDERKRAAVAILARAGYQRGKKCRSGAITNAAREAGCGRKAIYDWLEDPEFQEAIDEAKTAVRIACIRGLERGAEADSTASCMALLKSIEPEVYDEILRRDEAKRKFEREMAERRHQYEMEMLDRKHQQAIELAKLRASLGLPPEEMTRPLPPIVFVEDEPGAPPPQYVGKRVE